MKIIIEGSMPGINEIIAAAKNKYGKYKKYRDMKNEYTELVAWSCRSQLYRDCKIDECFIRINYFCKEKRRDKDNIAACKKFIFDGMQLAGVIKNDGWGEIQGWSEMFYIDKKNPRIEIEIIEM